MVHIIYRISLGVLKNLAVFLSGAVLGVLIIAFWPGKPPLALLGNKDIGLGIIALIPVLFIYFVVAGLAGGVLGVIIYNLVKFFRREKSQN